MFRVLLFDANLGSSPAFTAQITNPTIFREPRVLLPPCFPLFGAPRATRPIPGNTTVTLPLSFPCLQSLTPLMLDLAGDAPPNHAVRPNSYIQVGH